MTREHRLEDQTPALRKLVLSDQIRLTLSAARVIAHSKRDRLRDQFSALAVVFEYRVVAANRG